MLNPHGLHRLILEAVREHGRVTPADLPGIELDDYFRLVAELTEGALLLEDEEGLALTELGIAYLAQFE